MRPHRLSLTAFGSFPGSETVDFDALTEAGLFLVHGPTGAGKTTILDALCFALYGQVPGQRNSARALRCDHAPPSVGPSVSLEVSVRGRLLRIQRSPVWQRPKLRGSGFTEEKAKVIVEERAGSSWHGLTTRSDEAGDLVGGLLGMNADQFCQVAMLPQGDFARFLRADGDDRRRLLERLFTVKVFTQTESWLAEHRKTAWREQQELRQQVDFAIQRLEEAAGDLTPTAITAPDAVTEAAGSDAAVTGVPAPGGAVPGAAAMDGAAPSTPTPGAALPSAGALFDLPADPSAGPDTPGSHRSERRAAAPSAPDTGSPGSGTVPPGSDAEPPDADTDPLGWAGALLAAARAVVVRTTGQHETAGHALRSARSRFEQATSLADRQRRHAEALTLRRTLDERAEERAELQAILDDAARADRVLPLIRAARQRAEAAAKAHALATDAVARAHPLLKTTPTPASRSSSAPTAPSDDDASAISSAQAPAAYRLDRPREGSPAAASTPTPAAYPVDWPLTDPSHTPSDEESGSRALPRRANLVGWVEPERLRAMERDRQAEIARLSELLTEEARLLVVRRDLQRVEQELTGLAAEDESAATRLAALPALVAEAERKLAQARLDAARIPAAEAVRTAAAELIGVDRELSRLATELDGLTQREAEVAAADAELPARLADVNTRLSEVRAEAAAIPAAVATLEAAKAVRDAAHRGETLAAELESAAAAHQSLVDRAQGLREHWLDVRQARIDGMAAELARDLSDGSPCAVCGSDQHPHPASPAPSAPSADDEQAAESAHEAALSEREAAERALASLESRHTDAVSAAGGLDPATAESATLQAQEQLARLEAIAEREPALAAELDHIETERERVRDQSRDLGELLTAHRTHRTHFQAERTRLVTRLIQSGLLDTYVPTTDTGRLGTATGRPTGSAQSDSRVDLRTEDEADGSAQGRTDRGVASGEAVSVGDGGAEDGSDVSARARAERGAASEETVPGDGRGAEIGPELAPAVLAVAEKELERLRASAGLEAGLAREAAGLGQERVALEERVRRLSARLAAGRTRQEELSGDAGRLTARLDSARGDDSTLTARLSRLNDEAELLREALDATQAAVAAEAERVRAVEAAGRAALEAGFDDVADVESAARSEYERESKAELLRRLDAQHAAVTSTLADPELVAAAQQDVPDLAVAEAAREEAERAHTALASARDQAEQRERRVAELGAELAACIDRWQPAADRHRLAERLAALASGTSSDNQWSMSLSSFVLGERLRQVVDAANERLDHMSAGRYLLRHDLRKTAGARGRSGGGLGLRVADGWTGVDRDPATLSGGESFITSLALALGLADVVTAEAGGAEIGTLFVDEGFGTLDEDTLDGVLDILDGLRDGGRAVGIISHVAELRSRVPAQLKVSKTRTGSTLSTVGVG
ncbi:AAA family ATPase [Nonomuraea sp. NPDC049269]|uniref:AAA family ATPase n=1 Tax=Nonomuraea sp. NPDC049269 TaxID=3364349 RepID=UPI003715A302